MQRVFCLIAAINRVSYKYRKKCPLGAVALFAYFIINKYEFYVCYYKKDNGHVALNLFRIFSPITYSDNLLFNVFLYVSSS